MPKNRIYILDVLRIISAIGVIVVHTIAIWLSSFEVASYPWRIVNIIEWARHRSVPVFLMLTGIFLLREDKLDEDPIGFYRSRLIKVIIPFFICVWFFALFDYVILANKVFDLYHFILDFINVWYYYHLWYILVIIWLYIIIPFMRVIVKNSPVRLLYLYIYIRFGFKIVNQVLVQVFGVPRAWTPSWFLWYDVLAIIGYCVRYQKFIVSWLTTKKALFVYIFAAIATILWTWWISMREWKINEFFYQNNMPNVLVMAISLLVIARHLYDTLNIPDKYIYWIRKISKTSFGTYMYHPIFIYIFQHIFSKLWFSTWYNMILTAVCSIFWVWLFVYIIQKTSFWKKILPET